MKKEASQPENDFPKLSAPAQRALASAGVSHLKDLTKFSETEVKKWHGIGPNAMKQLHQAMMEKGLSFKNS